MPRKPRTSPNPPGAPAYAPEQKERDQVKLLRGAGTAPEVIARMLKISLFTLRKYFPDELAHGKDEVRARIGGKCIQKALAGDNSCIALYLRSHGGPGWQDKAKVEHTGPGGSPLPATNLTLQVVDPVEAARIYQRLLDDC